MSSETSVSMGFSQDEIFSANLVKQFNCGQDGVDVVNQTKHEDQSLFLRQSTEMSRYIKCFQLTAVPFSPFLKTNPKSELLSKVCVLKAAAGLSSQFR